MAVMDRTDFCSLYVAVDDFYLNKLLRTYETWVYLKPEILRMPPVFIYDRTQLAINDTRWGQLGRMFDQAKAYHTGRGLDMRGLQFRPSLVPWAMPNAESQRERMLTALVRCVTAVHTPWYLKLDADTYATGPQPWIQDQWFEGSPAIISAPWGYTKPAGTIARMNAWAEHVPQLACHPPVEYRSVDMGGGKTKDVHPRFISQVMFGNTEWSRFASGLCQGDRLPFPSQDTYLGYVMVRTGKRFVPVRWKQLGWDHQRNLAGMRAACDQAMAQVRRG